MCPEGYRFIRTAWPKVLINRPAAGANELVQVPANPERVGFVLGTGTGQMYYRPRIMGAGNQAGVYAPLTATQTQPLTADQWGQLIVEAWDFTLVSIGNNYCIIELSTTPDFK